MSSLSTFLQTELQNLSNEAKRKNPEIKAAAERLLYMLKDEHTQGLGYVLSKSEDTLKPFLLSCETNNPKLIPFAINCFHKLISHNAIPPESISQILQHLLEQVASPMDLQLKMLQTVLPLVSNYNVHGDNLAAALLLVYKLQDTRVPVVSNTAAATFRQIVVGTFEKLVREDAPHSDVDPFSESLKPCAQDCMLLFEHAPLLKLLKEDICPLLVKIFSEKQEFPLALRVMRTADSIIRNFHGILIMPCEIYLGIYCRILSGESPVWQVILVLESFCSVFEQGILSRSVFEAYDSNEHVANVYAELIQAAAKFIFSQGDKLVVPSDGDPAGFSSSSSTIRIPFMEQLDKSDPPSAPATYPLFLAIHCLVNLIESQSDFVLPLLQDNLKVDDESPKRDGTQIVLAIEMAKTASSSIFGALSFLSTSPIDDELFQIVTCHFEQFTTILGLLGLISERDAFISAICKSCVPGCAAVQIEFAAITKPLNVTSFAGIFQGRQPQMLNEHNMQFVRTLVALANSLYAVLDNKTWYVILETLQIVDGLMSTGKLGKRMESSPGLIGLDSPQTGVPFTRTRAQTMLTPRISQALIVHQATTYSIYTKKMFEITEKMKSRTLMEFVRALCRLTLEQAAALGAVNAKDKSDDRSYGVAKLVEIAILNIKRILDPADFSIWDIVIGQLVQMAHSLTVTAALRAQVLSAFGEILSAAVQFSDLNNEGVERRIMEPIKAMMAIESQAAGDPDISKVPWLPEVQRSCLETLNRLLQASGERFKYAWVTTLDIIQSVAKVSQFKKRNRPTVVVDIASVESSPLISGAAISIITESPISEILPVSQKSIMVTKVAFPCIQLICTDFLSLLNPAVLVRCIDTVSSYCSLQDNLNISLTAVALLWSLCDFILTKRHALEAETAAELPGDSLEYDSVDELTSDLYTTLSTAPLTKRTMDTLWMHILRNMSQICSDDRPEVRNSANQTLFRTIGMNGQLLSLSSWDLCISHVLFPLLERIKFSSQNAGNLSNTALSPASVSLSPELTPLGKRSPLKQWDETKILTLQGITKCFIDFLPVLLQLPKFDEAWLVFLNFVRTMCLEGTQEVSIAALKNFKSLVIFSKKVHDEGSISDSKLESMWTVIWHTWLSIGTDLAGPISLNKNNGLSTVFLLDSVPAPLEIGQYVWSDGTSASLIYGNMSQDCLVLYIQIFFDLYPVIHSTFGSFELDRLLNVLRQVLVYHTLPSPEQTITSMRADFINDLEAPSTLQLLVLSFVSEKLDFSHIDGNIECVIKFLSDIVKLPFISGSKKYEFPKKQTYMALSKKGLQQLVTVFEQHGGLSTIYVNGAFSDVLSSISIPMKLRYKCPRPGQKDSTPIWRAAANTAMTLIPVGLCALDVISRQQSLPAAEATDSIYEHLLDLFQDFLVVTEYLHLIRLNPQQITMDEAIADEDFDISFLTVIEKVIMTHLGQPHIDARFCSKLIEILVNGAHQTVDEDATFVYTDPGLSRMASLSTPFTSEHIINSVVSQTALTPPSPENRSRFAIASLVTLFSLCKKDKLEGTLHKPTASLPLTEITPALITEYLLAGSTAHLYSLYPVLCKLLAVVSGLQWAELATTDGSPRLNDEAVMSDAIIGCLVRVGSLFHGNTIDS